MIEAFYALQPQWIRFNRFFKVYLSTDSLLGVWMGGQFFDRASVRLQMFPLYLTVVGIPMVEATVRQVEQRRRRLERQYDEGIWDPGSALSKDRRNFLLPKDTIQAIRVSRKRSHWNGWLSRGILSVVQRDGGRFTLIVTGRQDLDGIVERLRGLGFPVENNPG